MSTTTSATLAIRDFAAAVRAALSDLPSEFVVPEGLSRASCQASSSSGIRM